MHLLYRISHYFGQNQIIAEHREKNHIIRSMVKQDTPPRTWVILDQERIAIVFFLHTKCIYLGFLFALEQGNLLHRQRHLLGKDNFLLLAPRVKEEVPFVASLEVICAASDSQTPIRDAQSYERLVSHLCLNDSLNVLVRVETDILKSAGLTLNLQLE